MNDFKNKSEASGPFASGGRNSSNWIDPDYYIFDDPTVRAVLFSFYTIVFVFCFFGNLTVVVVMTIHWKMRSITKYCIGNLAFANMCVGIFCVYQNFFMYIIGSWPFGDFLCKMFHFVNSLSHTASILILVVISVERYLVILHPFKCRQILTFKRLRLIILGVWLLSGILCLPRILYVVLIHNTLVSKTGEVTYDVICSIGSYLFASETMEIIQFLLLFLLPLLIISVLYYKVGQFLRKREAFNEEFLPTTLFEYEPQLSPELSNIRAERTPEEAKLMENVTVAHNEDVHHSIAQMNIHLLERLRKRKLRRLSLQSRKRAPNSSNSDSVKSDKNSNCSNCRKHNYQHRRMGRDICYTLKPRRKLRGKRKLVGSSGSKGKVNFKSMYVGSMSCQSNLIRINFSGTAVCCQDCGFFCCHSKISSPHRAHKDVIKLLVITVVTFAVCNFPYHLRKIYQNYFYKPENESDFDELATPITFLLMYANCAINPIVYAFMSKSFRTCVLDVSKCNCRRPAHP